MSASKGKKGRNSGKPKAINGPEKDHSAFARQWQKEKLSSVSFSVSSSTSVGPFYINMITRAGKKDEAHANMLIMGG